MTSLGFDVVNVTLDEAAVGCGGGVGCVNCEGRRRAAAATCGPLWVRPLSDRLALPLPSVMVAAVEIDGGRREAGGVCPATAV